jgi:maleylacetoacetate isomerase
MTDVILHDYWRSSSAYRVRIGLNLIGLAYRSVPVDLTKGEQRAPEHLKANPQGLVPCAGNRRPSPDPVARDPGIPR